MRKNWWRSKKLPPHTWERRSFANVGEVKKPFVIAMIALGVILILGLLLIFVPRFISVGKAIEFEVPLEDNQAGIFVKPGSSVALNTDFEVLASAKISDDTVAIGFTLDLPASISCANVQRMESLLGWNSGNGVFYDTIKCENNQVIFKYATLNWRLSKSDEFDVAKIYLEGLSTPGNYNFNFDSFEVISFTDHQNLISQPTNAIISVVGVAAAVVEEQPAPPSGGGGGSGGGRRSCTPKWNCNLWTYCNATLKQSRTCQDDNNCGPYTRLTIPKPEEVRNCTKCDESWTCDSWSSCSNNVQTRNCQDEHSCGTTLSMPELQKSCQQVAVPRPAPKQVLPPVTPPAARPAPVQPQIQEPAGIWEKYAAYLLGIPAILIFLIVLVIIIVHFAKRKRVVYNLDDLKKWVKEERAMGTSNEDIRKILVDHTGWSEEEINAAFKSLRNPQVNKQQINNQQVNNQQQKNPQPDNQKPQQPQ